MDDQPDEVEVRRNPGTFSEAKQEERDHQGCDKDRRVRIAEDCDRDDGDRDRNASGEVRVRLEPLSPAPLREPVSPFGADELGNGNRYLIDGSE